jgi:hypothetical protein
MTLMANAIGDLQAVRCPRNVSVTYPRLDNTAAAWAMTGAAVRPDSRLLCRAHAFKLEDPPSNAH